jgi:hypothetical protein
MMSAFMVSKLPWEECQRKLFRLAAPGRANFPLPVDTIAFARIVNRGG